MFSCLNTSARVNVLYRPMKTEIEEDFSSVAFSICLTVNVYEKTLVCAQHLKVGRQPYASLNRGTVRLPSHTKIRINQIKTKQVYCINHQYMTVHNLE
jgi:hypothetical protein